MPPNDHRDFRHEGELWEWLRKDVGLTLGTIAVVCFLLCVVVKYTLGIDKVVGGGDLLLFSALLLIASNGRIVRWRKLFPGSVPTCRNIRAVTTILMAGCFIFYGVNIIASKDVLIGLEPDILGDAKDWAAVGAAAAAASISLGIYGTVRVVYAVRGRRVFILEQPANV